MQPYRAEGADHVSEPNVQTPIWAVINEVEPFSPVPGVEMRPISGEKVMMNFLRIAPGAVVPDHSHPHEQAGTVFEGALILTLGGETRTLYKGDAYVIPGGVPHSATTDAGGCFVLDIFAPPRDDYRPENRKPASR
jgi:quercetin dioxygenase-like cupin family protein